MASYRYTVTIQEPARPLPLMTHELKMPDPIVRSFDKTNCGTRLTPSDIAVQYARLQYRRPDGTTVAITRRKILRPLPAALHIEGAPNVEYGSSEPYRRYVVQGGIVRRVDR